MDDILTVIDELQEILDTNYKLTLTQEEALQMTLDFLHEEAAELEVGEIIAELDDEFGFGGDED